MSPTDDELRAEMACRVRRDMLISIASVVVTLVLLGVVWLGTNAIFHGATPRPFVFVCAALFLIPLAVGIASARSNLRCPACNTSVSLQLAKKCPGCQKDILVVK